MTQSVLDVMRHVNNFYLNELHLGTHLPFICENSQIGLISPPVLDKLRAYPEVFTINNESVAINESLKDAGTRTTAVEKVLLDLRKNQQFTMLDGWRNESYEIKARFSHSPLFMMERAATPLFGTRQHGAHINGFVKHSTKGLCLWLQRRSPNKQTWPGLLDTFVGGGLSAGFGVLETAVKEAFEEANVPEELASSMKPAGTVSMYHRAGHSLYPNTEFVFDLELPENFVPKSNDGEVSGWELVPVNKVLDVIISKEYKTTSVPIAVDWLIRHGQLPVEMEANLPEIVELTHVPLHNIYKHPFTKL